MATPERSITQENLIEVIRAAAVGETISQTAKRLQYHPQTIYTWRKKAFDLLGAHSMPQAVYQACKKGWLLV